MTTVSTTYAYETYLDDIADEEARDALPTLSYNPALLTPSHFYLMEVENDIRIRRVYSVAPTPTMNSIFVNNYLDCLPDDITKHIMQMVDCVPSKDELMEHVMECEIQHEPYSLDEDQLDDELSFDELNGFHKIANFINHEIVDTWSDEDVAIIFNYYFRDINSAKRYIEKDEYDMDYWGSNDGLDVKRHAMRLLIFNTLLERYKIVFDKENVTREWVRDNDDGEPVYEYGCYTMITAK